MGLGLRDRPFPFYRRASGAPYESVRPSLFSSRGWSHKGSLPHPTVATSYRGRFAQFWGVGVSPGLSVGGFGLPQGSLQSRHFRHRVDFGFLLPRKPRKLLHPQCVKFRPGRPPPFSHFQFEGGVFDGVGHPRQEPMPHIGRSEGPRWTPLGQSQARRPGGFWAQACAGGGIELRPRRPNKTGEMTLRSRTENAGTGHGVFLDRVAE